MSTPPYEPIWGEVGVETSILDAFFKAHPVRVSVALARAGAEDGAYPFLCLRHTDLGLVTHAEFIAHLRTDTESIACVSCGADGVVPDNLTRWECGFAFPVRVTYPDGHSADGMYPGGSHIFWGGYAQRCSACLKAGLVTHFQLREHDAREAWRDQLRKDVHRDNN